MYKRKTQGPGDVPSLDLK